MSPILGLDLGKFKSLARLDDTETTAARFATVPTDPPGLRALLEAERPGLVVFETCTVAGWLADTCEELGLPYAVANPMHEAWSWRKVQRKTDRDDALKLARMAVLGERPGDRPPVRREGCPIGRGADPITASPAEGRAPASSELGRSDARPASGRSPGRPNG